MPLTARRVVITGLGVVTPIGETPAEYWKALAAGQSGVRPISLFDASALPVRIAAEVPNFDARKYIDKRERKNLKVMARTIQLAVAAAQLAMDDSRIDKAALDPTRFGIEFGAGLIATELQEIAPAAHASFRQDTGSVDLERWGEQGMANMPPLWMLKYLPNMLACHVSIMHNAQGPNNTVNESDVASLLALGEACRVLKRDQADFFLVGGGESKINPLSMCRQCLFQPLSRRNEAPEKACRPFDRNRDGMVIGEGAGVFAVEDLGHAQRRGARIYAEVVGFGSAYDRGRRGDGIARAVRVALAQAQVRPEDVDHVNAHATGDPFGDAWEARGLREVFGAVQPAVPVYAPKSYIGNLGATAGTVELAASILGLEPRLVPASLNYDEPDPECPVTVIREKPRPLERPYFVKVGATDMGQCAAVVCRRFDG